MFKVAAEIISSEITSWDNTILFYKKCMDLLDDIKTFYSSNKSNKQIVSLTQKFSMKLEIYQMMYEIIGDKTRNFFNDLKVPEVELIIELEKNNTPDLIKKINSQLRFDTNNPNADLSILNNKNGKMLILAHSLINIIGCEQFFRLCELRKKAQTSYEKMNLDLRQVLENLPKEFFNAFPNYNEKSFSQFEIYAAAIIQRFGKYRLLGNELMKCFPAAETLNKNDPVLLMIGLANIFIKLGGSYATWDNKARKIVSKAVSKEVENRNSIYDQLAIYRKAINENSNSIDEQIKDIENKLNKVKKVGIITDIKNLLRKNDDEKRNKLINDLSTEIQALKNLKESYQKGLGRVIELQENIIKNEVEELKDMENNIKFCRSEAAVSLSLIYKELKLSAPAFERNLPKHSAYVPNSEQTTSGNFISLNNISQSETHDVITLNNSNDVKSSFTRKRRKTFVNSFMSGVNNVKDLLKRTDSDSMLIKITRVDEVHTAKQETHSEEPINSIIEAIPSEILRFAQDDMHAKRDDMYAKRDDKQESDQLGERHDNQSNKQNSNQFGKQESNQNNSEVLAPRKKSLAEKYLTQIEEQKSQKKLIVEEKVDFDFNVQSLVENYENISNARKTIEIVYNEVDQGISRLETEIKNLSIQEKNSSTSNNANTMFRGRSRTSPTLKITIDQSKNEDATMDKSASQGNYGKVPGKF